MPIDNTTFPYLRGAGAAANDPTTPQVTQGDTANDDAPEAFDDAAEAGDIEDGWVFPDPGALEGTGVDTPLARTRGQQRLLTDNVSASTPGRGTETPLQERATSTPGDTTTTPRTRPAPEATPGRAQTTGTDNNSSALILACQTLGKTFTLQKLHEFLAWQAGRRADGEEQKRFREDAQGYPQLLVFGTMRKKSPFVHLMHSVGIYPRVPRADPEWQGKSIGFLGDRTRFSNPQMVELGRTTAWGWEDQQVSRDGIAMTAHYGTPANRERFWTPAPEAPRHRTVCPRMLALPPDCAIYCAQERRTPGELYAYVTQMLSSSSDLEPGAFELILDWCCMAAQPGSGTNSGSSILSFVTPAVLGASEHLQEWAHHRLATTLPQPTTFNSNPGAAAGHNRQLLGELSGVANSEGGAPVSMVAQVTAAVVAAMRAGEAQASSATDKSAKEDQKPYSEYQLAKLKGFSCIRNEAHLQPIWEYFRSTKDVDAQRTKLLQEMRQWARTHDVQINRSLYFDKSTMDDIVKLEFCPGTPTAYLSTAEQGISILICRPRTGNETADIRSREQAVKFTERNQSLSEALLLGKRDPRQPPSSYHELKLDLGTFCALLWTLFGDRCDYYDNCFALYNMLDSESVFANAPNFTAQICRQITWAVLNDSRQYFFRMLTTDDFAAGRLIWPTSLLMQIVGADVHACREIRMGNFPEKWGPRSTVASLAMGSHTKGTGQEVALGVHVPAGHPPAWPSSFPTSPPAAIQSGGSGIERPVYIRQNDIHPKIKTLMSPYISHFRSIQFRLLLKAAGVTEGDLPSLPKYLSNGRNGMCYSYVLGKCQGRVCGRAQGGHVPVSEISDAFATELCSKLAPGVERRLATEPPGTPDKFAAPQGGKRYKRAN